MRRKLSQLICLSMLGVLPVTVLAQNATQQQPAAQPGAFQPGGNQPGGLPGAPGRQRTTANKPVLGDQTNNRDQQIASYLLICNHKEVRMSELAKAHAKNKEVKEFADKMVQEHTQMVSTLQRLGGQAGAGGSNSQSGVSSGGSDSGGNSGSGNSGTGSSNGGAAGVGGNTQNGTQIGVSGGLPNANQPGGLQVQINRDPNERREARAERRADRAGEADALGTSGGAAGGAAGQQFDFVSIQREIADRCVAEAEREWSSKKAEECDMAYIGAQIIAHKDMIQTGKVLRQYAGPELQTEIDKGVQTAERHLEHAMKVIETLSEEEKSDKKSS
ncbi:MAG: DUF4142 domain-containing protein [Pirellulales bacterium]|nr:DUF4142 domain-containing protein [Pirellulales bacterium]